ncbi:glycosyltransferase family 2 protein [Aequorivita sinensis]|uniref:glycosyltransferase family 2 protein n=1 Tax=Aequorivita sinensis TaxID=1382458 RepID=UPI00112184DA|nr:glycosyltransferase [Aequorivita sinensis]
MTSPLISVIIPVYNVEKYIEKCITSIVKQTYENLEIILINDGSTDNSPNICKKFETLDSRVKFFTQTNQGVSAARNLGLNKATGEWVYFIDADDFLELNTFQLLSKEFAPDLDVIQFGLSAIKNEKVIGRKHPPKYLKVFNKKEIFENIIMKPLSACLVIIRKSVIDKNNIKFNETLKHNEDSLFVFQVLANCNGLLFYNNAFYNMIVRNNSATSKPISINRINNKLLYLQLLISYFKERGLVKFIIKDIESGLKNFFVDISNYNFKNSKEKLKLKKNFKQFYTINKPYLKALFIRMANINIFIVVIFLKLKYLFR